MNKRRQYTGVVVSNKMQKTCVVKVTRLGKHYKYDKVMKMPIKFKVHDEKNVAKIGDVVSIEETRPLSKDKHFRLIAVVNQAKAPEIILKEE